MNDRTLRRHRALASLAIAALSVLVLGMVPNASAGGPYPGALAAMSSRSVAIKGLQDSFHLAASNGYTVTVYGAPNQGSSASVSLTASHPHGTATYLADSSKAATATSTEIKASFDRYGTVNVKFHPQRTKTASPPAGCTGKKAKEETGVWKGTITFKGESGYTSVNAGSAKGRVIWPDWRCTDTGKPSTILSAYEPPPGGIGPAPLEFTAIKPDASSTARFTASTFEYNFGSGGGVAIMRSAFVNAPATSTFTFNQGLTAATAKPPAPFSGSGQYSQGKWSGALTANFPGRSHVSLAGPDWKASLKHGSA